MTKRDYLIIFLLLLPFFLTFPWALVTRHQLRKQIAKTEMVEDSLSYLKWYYRSRLETVESIRRQNEELERNRRLMAENQEGTAEESVETIPVENTTVAFRDTTRFANWKKQEQEKRETIAQEEVVRLEEPVEPIPPVTTQPEMPTPKPAPSQPVRAVRLVPDPINLEPVDERMWARLRSKESEVPRSEWMEVRMIQEIPAGEPAGSANIRRLEVDMALNQVPRNFWGQQTLYLVVTDRSGIPVSGNAPVSARLPLNDVEIEMTAMVKKDVSLQGNQEIRLEQVISERLPSGEYRVQIFSDAALLAMMDLTLL
ncbi:MAG: hypothetical protein AAFN92_07210 [Bacteroidota bacterium]